MTTRAAWAVAAALAAAVLAAGSMAAAAAMGAPAPAPAAGAPAAAGAAAAEGGTVAVGLGSYATVPPPGAKPPPATVYRTARLRGPMPTGDWWSSLAWMPFSERQYAHPLAFKAEPGGLRVHYPGPRIRATKDAILGAMPDGSGEDFVVGHSAVDAFADARVDGASDWFVEARFGEPGRGMTAAYGHGSPYVYARYEGGTARVTFARPPEVWSGGAGGPALGVAVDGRAYGLFGPAGSSWEGVGGRVLVNRAGARGYLTAAVLPERSEEALALARRYAHAHVTGTRVGWRWDPATGAVTTTFTVTTTPVEGTERGTLFALYPHQWRHTDAALTKYTYASVRGTMRLGAGTGFATRVVFPGVLPCLPEVGAADRGAMEGLLAEEARRGEPATRDTYWEGKHLGRLATLVPLAEAYGRADVAAALGDRLRRRLEGWLSAAEGGRPKTRGLFYYDAAWGTLIGHPASYGSDAELNDHHFHYGYFVRAAAEAARADPAWAAPGRWGGMVDLVVRDMACPDRDDARLPWLRHFDPYAGHSWASGHARFGDGNNQESSSEAMNAWYALILWGEAAGRPEIRDLGIYLYTTEMTAAHEYWFDVHGEHFPAGYERAAVAMVWGGKGVHATWFSANPEAVHGINWLPLHGGSLYLGAYPDHVRKEYAAMARENGGEMWDQWADLAWMVLALAEPERAVARFEAAGGRYPAEDGNSAANTRHWLYTLRALGRVDRGVTADWPLAACFRQGSRRTYVVYRMREAAGAGTVRFSDGTRVDARARGFTVGKKEAGSQK